ncbi:MAG TPA: cobalamin B12-binding domain-containing protein [bacterium]|nr:cobalamin B12-binding domain-containing protein [bacterium]
MSNQPIRVLVAKAGLDSHDRGAKVIARALRDAGMEVIYLGLHNTPKHIVSSAIQEDVDVIVVSSLAGAHMTVYPAILDELHTQKSTIPVLGGGVIPDDDAVELEKKGVKKIMGPGTRLQDIVDLINTFK